MLRVRLLGELAVEVDGRPVATPAGRRGRELLAWLALHPGMHERGTLAATFWPDVLDASARGSLRTALHELRQALGPAADCLAGDRARVGLAHPDGVWTDALAVEALARDGREEEALALCKGELAPGLDADWAVTARQEHRDRVSALYVHLADAAEAAGEPVAALRWTRRLVAEDGLSEEGHRRLIRGLAAAGDRPAALAAYGRLEERLRRELGVAPSRATRELVAEIRGGEGVEPSRAAPMAGVRPPLPPPLRRRERSALVGRRAELERAGAALRATLEGERRVVFVAGEPGIGKTRLLSELARRWYADGATVLFGRCSEEQLAPYQPFVEALSWYAADAGPDALAGGDELAPLIPALGAPPAQPADGEGARWRLFEAVANTLGRAAREAPVLVALDDLHWADSATLLLLAHLADRPGRVAYVGSYRESELSRTHPLSAALADLHRDGLVERIVLGGLSEPEVAALVAGSPGTATRAGLARAVHAETGGNPFFVEEVVRHLAAAGAADQIPESVKDVIGRRLSRLRPETDRVLQVAAVAGREFELAVLERVDALGAIDVLAALEEAEAAQMVREEAAAPGHYGFVHALIRETLYGELGLARRVRTHAALAAALESLDDGDARLGALAHHHLEAAAGGNQARAVGFALRAAAADSAGYAYEEAAVLCERALGVLEGVTGAEALRGDALIALGEARLRAGRPPMAREAFAAAAEVARALGDADLLARAALGVSGLGVRIIAVDDEKVALLEEALAAAPPDGALRARLVARLAIETYYVSTPEQRKALGDEAVALARASADEHALADALNARHVALWSAAYLEERIATADEMIALAIRLGDPERELQGRNWRVCDLGELGDVERMEEEIAAHERLADRLRLPGYRWWAPMWRATLAIADGRIDDAERLIAEIEAIGREAQDDNALLYAEMQRIGVRVVTETLGELEEAIMLRERGRPAEYAYRSGYSWMLAVAGRLDESRAEIDWVTRDDFARLRDDTNRVSALCELAEAIALVGGHPQAEGVYERLVPYADRNALNGRAASGYGSAQHALGLLARSLGRDDAAAAHFEAAIERNAALGARPWVARSRDAYAELLLERGEAPRAVELLRSAAATAREVGIAPLTRRIEAHLRDAEDALARAGG